LARAEFLLGLAELESQEGVRLHKGAGQPTDEAGLSFARANGMDALGRVAKLHFKNTGKIARRLG
jgi:ribonuclease HIII